jgi:glycosyltransferase involved in cell wall biosynthesis
MAASSSAGHYPSTAAARPLRVLAVVSGWPRLSETFAQNELAAMHRTGMLAGIVATKPGDPALVQPGLDALTPLVTHLPAGDAAAQADALVDHVRSMDGGVDAIHGYFAHRPAEIAAAAARRLGIPFGFSVHALDLRKVGPDELRRRAAAAAVVVTCNSDAFLALDAVGVNAHLVPHGVDLDRFRPGPAVHGDTVRLLAVGRLVEKKGFPTLIDAMAELAELAELAAAGTRTAFELTIVGEGADRSLLEDRIAAQGLGAAVHLAGRTTHDELPAMYRSADIVVAPSVVDRNGDRDGLPNVVLESMACGRPLIASDVAAIASAVTHDHDGVLVPPADAHALAAAIRELAADTERRARLALAARRTVEERFELHGCSNRFCHELAAAFSPLPAGGVRP